MCVSMLTFLFLRVWSCPLGTWSKTADSRAPRPSGTKSAVHRVLELHSARTQLT